MNNYIGQKYNRLTVIERTNEKRERAYVYKFKCDCGNTYYNTIGQVKGGGTKSCGCLRKESTTKRNTKHGKAWSPSWRSWNTMLRRCHDESFEKYPSYGGRGIEVCDRWNPHKGGSFNNFYEDMGDRPKDMTIDRIDTNGNYEPGNCRWANATLQASNSSNTVYITIGGQTKTFQEWLYESPLTRAGVLRRRQVKGWSWEECLFAPKERKGKRKAKPVMFNGDDTSLYELCDRFKICQRTFFRCLGRGLKPEEIVEKYRRD